MDAPGHRDYVKNMISGAGQPNLVLVRRPTGEVEGQTSCLQALLGVEQIIVGINKMDTCDWSETRFNEIKDEFFKMLKDSGLKPTRFIHYSGFQGENLVEKTDCLGTKVGLLI